MEGGGLAHAAQAMNRRYIEIRGISDMADGLRGKDDEYQPVAAATAHAAAEGFLRMMWSEEILAQSH